jgi:DNA-damage-inducible protein J
MSKSAVVHARIEPHTKKKAETVLSRLGMSPTEAIRLFYHQICLRDGLPFEVRIPNKLTRSVLAKSRKGQEIETFDSLDQMAASWKK